MLWTKDIDFFKSSSKLAADGESMVFLFFLLFFFPISSKKLSDVISVNFFEAMNMAYSFHHHSAVKDPRWLLAKKNYERACAVEFSDTKMPKIPFLLHLIWLGSKPPDRYYSFIKEFKKLHPHWHIRLWTDRDARKFPMIRRKDFEQAQNFGEKSDIFRYELLYIYGGLYMDGDFEILQSLNDLHYVCDFYAGIGYLPNVLIYNGLIGCSARHPIIKKCIDTLTGGDFDTIQERTGPQLLTRAYFKSYRESPGISLLLPTPFFYPFPNCDREEHDYDKIMATAQPYSYALHLWASSWVPQNKQ